MLPSNVTANRLVSHQAHIAERFFLPEIDATSLAASATRAGEVAYDVPTQQIVYADATKVWQPAGNALVTALTIDDESTALPNSRRLVSSSSIQVVDNGPGSTVQLTSTGVATTLSSGGGTQSVVATGSGAALATKGLSAGTAVSLSADTSAVTITNASPASSISLTSAGGAQSLVVGNTGPALSLKGLTPGANVTLTPTATDLTIAAALTGIRTDRVITIDTNDSNHAIAASALAPGALYQALFGTTARTLTLPSVASLLAALPTLTTNSSYPVYFCVVSAGTVSFAAGTGWTLAGVGGGIVGTSAGVAIVQITDAVAQTATFYTPR